MPNAVTEKILNAGLVVVATCALATTALAAYRTFRPPAPTPPPAAVEVSDWRRFASAGHRLGPANAPVTIVEFSDFECSFCKTAANTLSAARAKYGAQVAIVYRHFPLERIHPMARSAAVAAECGARQGLFEAVHDALFAQDSLTAGSLTAVALSAGVKDTAAFKSCLEDPAPAAIVDRDSLDARKLKVSGTPTVLVNQYRITMGASPPVVDSLIQLALREK
jgi:protein-disulfide isomerase